MFKSIALIAAVALLTPLPLGADGLRQWTSKDGRETITARLHSDDGSMVTLILPNGNSRIVSKSMLSDADLEFIAGGAEADGDGAASGAPGALARALDGKLFDERGREATLGATGPDTKFLFYYSASWCPPCRAFTPELVRFARRHDGRVAVVLVPSDRSKGDAADYLKDYKMPWPALDVFGGRPEAPIPGNPNRFIPSMRLTDADGKTLLSNSRSVSPGEFLAKAGDLLD